MEKIDEEMPSVDDNFMFWLYYLYIGEKNLNKLRCDRFDSTVKEKNKSVYSSSISRFHQPKPWVDVKQLKILEKNNLLVMNNDRYIQSKL